MATKKKDTDTTDTKKKAAATKAPAKAKDKAPAKSKTVTPEVITPGKKKAPAKDAAATPEAPKGKFPPAPDAEKSGPPFQYDASNLCLNPLVTALRLPGGVAVYLCVAERDKTWFGCNRMDIPGDTKNPDGLTAGTDKPFCGTDSSFGFHTQAQALFEAGRDALNALQLHYGKNPGKEGRAVLFEAEGAVKALTPPSAKLTAMDTGIIGYRPQDSAAYMTAFSLFSATHHSGVIFPENVTREDLKNFGLGMAHIGRTSKWVMADWYNFAAKHHKDLLDEMLSEGNRQTIHNEAQVAKRFAPDERIPELSFTHHQEAAFVDSKAKRGKYLEQALAEGLSVKKLRDLIKGPAALPQGGTVPEGGSTTTTETTTSTTATSDSSPATPEESASPAATPEPEFALNGDPAPAAGDGKGEFEEEDGPGEKAEKDYESLLEHMDEVQTLIKRGALNPEYIKPTKIHQIKLIITQIAEATGLVVTSPATPKK